MVRPRIQLHELLKGLDESIREVYFQPPNGLKMLYPCLVYEVDGANVLHADNRPHRTDTRYAITVIDRNPDSPIPQKVANLPLSAFNRAFTADDLNHYVYNLYF